MAPRAVARTNVALRGLQFVASLASLALLSVSFQDTFANGFSHRIGSPSASFLMLVVYSTMMYAGWSLACVELYPLVARPRILMMRALDGVAVVMLLAAGLAVFKSDFVNHCDAYGASLRCNNLNTSVFFTFMTVLVFVASIALTYVKHAPDRETTMEAACYVVETTPTHAVFSPRPAANAPPTPSAKV